MQKTCRFLSVCSLILLVSATAGAEIKNPDTFVLATYGTVRTLDPAAPKGNRCVEPTAGRGKV